MNKIAIGENIEIEVLNSKGKFKKSWGKTKQATRSGKNLFKPSNAESYGITTTYDKFGIGTISGTTTNSWVNISGYFLNVIPAGKYTISLDSIKSFNVGFKGGYSDGTLFDFAIPAGQTRKTIILSKETKSYYLYITGISNGTISNTTIQFQLEAGEVATLYEPYGASPSPDYPSRIRNAGDNVQLFNGIFESTTKNGITSKYSDGILTLNGTATGQTDIVWNGNFTMKANTSYIITSYYQSGTITGSAMFYGQNSTNWLGFNLSLGNSNTSQIRDEYYTNNNLDFNVNKFIRIASGTIFDNYKIKIKIEEGSTATPYTEYGCGSIDYRIENEDKTESKAIHFPLSKGQLLHEGDYLASDGIHQKRETLVLDGTENWALNTTYENTFYCNKPANLLKNSMKYSNITTNFDRTLSTVSDGISIGLYLNVKNSNISTLEEFINEVKNNNIVIEYELPEEVITPLTAEQLLAYEQMDGIVLYNGKNYITTINELKPKIEFLYEIRNIKDEQIYVLNKNEELIAVFNRDDEDTIFNPRIKDTQNAESVFTFSISPNNPKWKEIKDPENLYLVDNKIYSTNFEGCFQETISDNNEDYILVTAYERQKLLTRKYVRAWNSETGFEAIDTFMVVVLSNGNLPLKNNNVLVNSSHLSGTSGYALDALLYGTGWKTGICDVEGTFDLETDQVDIYENILKIQQIWGGILVFDSVNKIVHHRDETKYLPYNGYEVRYRKNMQSLEKLYNNKIVTRLCPLGEGGLNIKSVNNGSEWLTNFSYTDSVLEGIENNPDILDSTQLKAWGERKLKDLCKPRKELTVQAILLYQVEGYELETIELNDIVDVINFANIDGDIEQLRVVSFDYGIWDFSDAVLELSDITLESTDIFKKTVSASNSINSGTLNSNKVVNFFKNGQSISTTLKNMDTTIEETTSKLTKSDEEINGKITKITTDMDSISGEIENQIKEINDLKLTIKGLTNQYSISGGNNLIRNSVGFFNNEFWEGTIVKDIDTDVKINNESKCGFKLQSGNAAQSVNQLKNGVYNISFNYKKILTAANVKVYINEESYDLTNTDWTSFEQVVTITNNKFTIKFNTDTNNSCIISDLLFVAGIAKQSWSQNANETSTDTVQIGKGIQVDSTETNTYTRIDSDGNRTYNKSTGKVVNVATDKGSEMEELVVRTKAQIVGLLYQKIDGQVFENLL